MKKKDDFSYYTSLFEIQYINLIILWGLRPVCQPVRLYTQIRDLCKAQAV